MKLAIIGSRDFNDYSLLKQVCDMIHKKYIFTHIVSGGARGADSLGERFCEEYNLKLETYIPDWKTHGKSAGYKRNVDIVSNADVVVAFWDGESKGTQHSINLANQMKKRLIVFNYKTNKFYSK